MKVAKFVVKKFYYLAKRYPEIVQTPEKGKKKAQQSKNKMRLTTEQVLKS